MAAKLLYSTPVITCDNLFFVIIFLFVHDWAGSASE